MSCNEETRKEKCKKKKSEEKLECPGNDGIDYESWNKCVRHGALSVGLGIFLGTVGTVFLATDAPLLIGTGVGLGWAVKQCNKQYIEKDPAYQAELAKEKAEKERKAQEKAARQAELEKLRVKQQKQQQSKGGLTCCHCCKCVKCSTCKAKEDIAAKAAEELRKAKEEEARRLKEEEERRKKEERALLCKQDGWEACWLFKKKGNKDNLGAEGSLNAKCKGNSKTTPKETKTPPPDPADKCKHTKTQQTKPTKQSKQPKPPAEPIDCESNKTTIDKSKRSNKTVESHSDCKQSPGGNMSSKQSTARPCTRKEHLPQEQCKTKKMKNHTQTEKCEKEKVTPSVQETCTCDTTYVESQANKSCAESENVNKELPPNNSRPTTVCE